MCVQTKCPASHLPNAIPKGRDTTKMFYREHVPSLLPPFPPAPCSLPSPNRSLCSQVFFSSFSNTGSTATSISHTRDSRTLSGPLRGSLKDQDFLPRSGWPCGAFIVMQIYLSPIQGNHLSPQWSNSTPALVFFVLSAGKPLAFSWKRQLQGLLGACWRGHGLSF